MLNLILSFALYRDVLQLEKDGTVIWIISLQIGGHPTGILEPGQIIIEKV